LERIVMVKSAPLETFLTGVRGAGKGLSIGESQEKTKVEDQSKEDVGRTVMLTILSQSSEPIAEEDLAAKAQLERDWFEQVLQGLQRDQLIQRSGTGFVLTDRGLYSANQARTRLLSTW
jgi:hypothetical protein